MNNMIKLICERRSVRNFSDKEIPKDLLKEILNCGTFAPNGMGRQSATIIAITNKETINKIKKINSSILNRSDFDPFYNAQTIIVVLANKNIPTYVKDGSAVITNILNAAFSLGIDSCWIDRAKETFETNEGKELLKKWGLTNEYEGIGNIALGYRNGELPAPAKRKENYIIYD